MLYKQIINDSTMPEKVCSSEVLLSIVVKLGNKKNCIQNQRTAVSWMQYMGMVDVLRKVIKSERTANSSGCLRHAVILCCCGSQPVCEIRLHISEDDA